MTENADIMRHVVDKLTQYDTQHTVDSFKMGFKKCPDFRSLTQTSISFWIYFLPYNVELASGTLVHSN